MLEGCLKSMKSESVIAINDDVKTEKAISTIKSKIVGALPKDGTIWLVFLFGYNAVVIYYFCTWINSTHSLALAAYTNTLFFNLCSLLVCLITIWVEQTNFIQSDAATCEKLQTDSVEYGMDSQFCSLDHENSIAKKMFLQPSINVLGFERYEVLCILLSSGTTLLLGSVITVIGVLRTKAQSHFHIDLFYVFIGVSTYFITVITYPEVELDNAISVLLPYTIFREINPIFGYNVINSAIICISYFIQYFWDSHIIDTIVAFCLVGLTAALMLPLAFFTSRIVFHNFTHCMSERLDKCLREALFLDGVMEFRNEKFWTISFGKIAGTLEVRIRKNADEDYVLRNVMRHLSRVITTLTVHKYHEKRDTSTGSEHYSVEYYIDEILSDETRRGEPWHLEMKCNQIKTQTTAKDTADLNIRDIISSQKTTNRKHSQRKNVVQNRIVYPEHEIVLKNYLYRPNSIRNPLLRNLMDIS